MYIIIIIQNVKNSVPRAAFLGHLFGITREFIRNLRQNSKQKDERLLLLVTKYICLQGRRFKLLGLLCLRGCNLKK